MMDSTLVEVGVMILVLKVFVDYTLKIVDKLTNKNKTAVSPPTSNDTTQLIKETHRLTCDIHTSVVRPDRVPLIAMIGERSERRRNARMDG